MAEKSGVMTAVAGLLDDLPVLQPALFPADLVATLEPGASLRARPPGRPLGSRNRRTQQFRDYVLARSGEHPVDGLIEAYLRPVHVLAAELQCTLLEAMRVQMDARRVVLEYTEGKMPVTVHHTGQGVIPIIFEAGPGEAVPTVESEWFQATSEGELDGGELDSGG